MAPPESALLRGFGGGREGYRIHSPGFTYYYVTEPAMRRSGEHGETVRGAGRFHTPVTQRFGWVIAFHKSAKCIGDIDLDAVSGIWFQKRTTSLSIRTPIAFCDSCHKLS